MVSFVQIHCPLSYFLSSLRRHTCSLLFLVIFFTLLTVCFAFVLGFFVCLFVCLQTDIHNSEMIYSILV